MKEYPLNYTTVSAVFAMVALSACVEPDPLRPAPGSAIGVAQPIPASISAPVKRKSSKASPVVAAKPSRPERPRMEINEAPVYSAPTTQKEPVVVDLYG